MGPVVLGLFVLLGSVGAQVTQYRVEADLEGVLFLLKGAGEEVRWSGTVPEREERGDTLVLRFASRHPAPLGLFGVVPDTITLRLPEGAEVMVDVRLRDGWADLDLSGLRASRVAGEVRRGKLSLHWDEESRCGPVNLSVGIGAVELSGLGWSRPPLVVISGSLARVRLDLFQAPRRRVPVVVTGNLVELHVRAGDVPLVLRRAGLFQLGKAVHRPGEGFEILFSGNFGRVIWEP